MKSEITEQLKPRINVAPPVGAWIEISLIFTWPSVLSVAPPVGAWVEIIATL